MTTDHSNIAILKEIAELLNEETEMVPMLNEALSKFLSGTKFETGWIFFIDEKGKSSSNKIYQRHLLIIIVSI